MLNLLVLHARFTKDPELRVTPKGTPVVALSLANNRRFKTEAGELKTETTFINAEAWGKTAETIAKSFGKGQPIIVKGRLKMDTYIEKDTEKERNVLKMVVEEFDFASPKENESDGAHEADIAATVPA